MEALTWIARTSSTDVEKISLVYVMLDPLESDELRAKIAVLVRLGSQES